MVGLLIFIVIAHWADHFLDERDLTSGEAIFRVEVLIRPASSSLRKNREIEPCFDPVRLGDCESGISRD